MRWLSFSSSLPSGETYFPPSLEKLPLNGKIQDHQGFWTPRSAHVTHARWLLR
jgi:hypothetical protein